LPFLAPIVEGHGEVEALPALLHRIARANAFQGALHVNPPIRVKLGSFLHDSDFFRRYVMLASEKAVQEGGSVLILLDCDDECPAKLGPELLRRARNVRSDVGMFVSLAHREFESWFITAIRSLRGVRGLPNDLLPPHNSERIRDAKGWLGERMNVAYDPVTHQIEFTRKIDLSEACSNQSFNRLYQHVCRMLEG
jgi:hypothetical protein